jgi:predicted TIM-barrel fold metal-dependent hydrolase
VIDPHHHLWDLSLYRYPWLEAHPQPDPLASVRRNYLVDDFLADTRNQDLVKSVHVQAEIDPSQSLAETEWLQGIADARGFPHGIVAWAPLQEGAAAEQALAAHARYPNVRGIRQLLNWDADPARSQCDRPDYMTDGQWRAGYALLGKYGLSYDLQAFPFQLEDAAKLAGDFPDTPMIVNHTGMPRDRDPASLEVWRRGMRSLAERPNVSVKISGLGMSEPTWSAESIRPLVLETIDIFGADRSMFASNFPVDKAFSSYDVLYDAFKTITAGFSADERRALFHDNAERIYRL